MKGEAFDNCYDFHGRNGQCQLLEVSEELKGFILAWYPDKGYMVWSIYKDFIGKDELAQYFLAEAKKRYDGNL